MIESKVIKMTSKKMFYVLFLQSGTLWLLILLSGVIVFSLIGALYNLKFFMLALMWIFLVLPMVTAFLYFYYGMRPLTAFNTIPHKLSFSADRITVKFMEEKDSELVYVPEKDYSIIKTGGIGIKTGGDYVILSFNKSGWLWLPISGFDSINQFQEAIKVCENK